MTKAELAREVALLTGLDQPTALLAVEGVMRVIKQALRRGEPVFLRGFGSFALRRRAQKTARDIRSNTSVVVPAHDVAVFKPSRELLPKGEV